MYGYCYCYHIVMYLYSMGDCILHGRLYRILHGGGCRCGRMAKGNLNAWRPFCVKRKIPLDNNTYIPFIETGRQTQWCPTRIFWWRTSIISASAKNAIVITGRADPLRMVVFHQKIPIWIAPPESLRKWGYQNEWRPLSVCRQKSPLNWMGWPNHQEWPSFIMAALRGSTITQHRNVRRQKLP